MRTVLSSVYESLKEKGYNPIKIVDTSFLKTQPTLPPTIMHAVLFRIDRDELLQTLVTEYLKMNKINF